MNFEELLKQLHVDAQKVSVRFGGMLQILEKFILRFPEDPTFKELEKAISNRDDSGDFEAIERGIHTLKGLGANLGLEELSGLSADALARVRNQEYEHLQEDFEAISKEYWRIVENINQYNAK